MQGKPSPRRVRVERSIYRRDTATGSRYEITYVDSLGRRRWQVTEGGLKDARAVLANVVSRLSRGERVAPSKLTLSEIAATWLEAQRDRLRPRTIERYEAVLRLHILPRLGRFRAASITEDEVAELIRALRAAGLAPASINKAVMVLGRILANAVRRGLIPANPVARLERGERPKTERREMRVLERDEIGALLDASDVAYRPLLTTAVFTGLRLGEVLGLIWGDIDLEAGLIRVRKQLDLDGVRVTPKTPQAVREVVLMPSLGRILREHRLASRFPGDHDPVFVSSIGTPMHRRNVNRRGLGKAAERAGLSGDGRPNLRFHELRHTFASLLIAEGANVVFVSRQLGHASPDITLKVYAHLFDRLAHAEQTRRVLEASYGNVLESSGGDRRQVAAAVVPLKRTSPRDSDNHGELRSTARSL
jgi:integrase